jgi:pimeloyl-ACP methyl ester carboxylesterase
MRLSVNGLKLYFDVDGPALVPRGPTMVERPCTILVHGGPGFDHTGFKPAYARLARASQLIYLDLRGNGRSDRGERSSWNLRQWAADIHEFCRTLEIPRPQILGASFGGEVAMQYAVDYPGDIGKLILISATARLRVDRSLRVFERLGGPAARDAAQRYWTSTTSESHAEYFRQCVPLYNRRPRDPEGFERATMHADVALHYNGGEAHTMNLLPQLHKVTCPTLIVAGVDDPITTLEDAEDILQALPAGLGTLQRIPRSGHMPTIDDPETVFAAIEAFLGIPAGAAE